MEEQDMKRILKPIVFAIVTLLVTNNIAFASVDITNTSELDILANEEVVLKEYQEELQPLRKIHNEIVSKKDFCLNIDGSISINLDSDIAYNYPEDFKEYLDRINKLNGIIGLGIISFDENFTPITKSMEEIIEIMSKGDKKLESIYNFTDNQHKLNIPNVPLTSLTSTYPVLYAYNIATNNYYMIQDYMQTLLIVSPISAYASTVALWVSLVMEGGAWDYKVQPGYSPWYTTWSVQCKHRVYTKNSAWFGNYNYGFTGKLMFNLDTLLLAGDAISGLTGKGFIDEPEDKAAVTMGYNENTLQ